MKIPIIVGIVLLFAAVGLGLYFSDFTIFLGSDPAACNKCHVMDAQYEGWNKSTHRQWAVCSECHAPHAFIPKYYVKMKSGLNDVIHFTLGDIPNPLRAHKSTGKIIQRNCIRCHSEAVSMIADGTEDSGRYCFDCHSNVAHGDRGIVISPYREEWVYQQITGEGEEK